LPAISLAADPPAKTRRTDKYQIAAAKTYNMHAHDHARLLSKYAAASSAAVPAAVLKEHAAAIRSNAAAATKAYSQISAATKNDPKNVAQMAEIQQSLAKVTSLVNELEAQKMEDQVAEAKLIQEKMAAVNQELKETHEASKKIDAAISMANQNTDEFEDRQSDSYYFTGKGHFID